MTTIVIGSGNQKVHALIAYVLMLVGLFTAIPLVIGGIWAMVTRSDAIGTVYHSHYTNAIRTFWWSLFWFILGSILVYIGIGILILGINWLWVFYRMTRGLIRLSGDQAYPI